MTENGRLTAQVKEPITCHHLCQTSPHTINQKERHQLIVYSIKLAEERSFGLYVYILPNYVAMKASFLLHSTPNQLLTSLLISFIPFQQHPPHISPNPHHCLSQSPFTPFSSLHPLPPSLPPLLSSSLPTSCDCQLLLFSFASEVAEAFSDIYMRESKWMS